MDFVAYFDASTPQNYFLSVLDGNAVADTFYFREIEGASSDATATQKWYLSAASSLTSDTLSWIGHGILDTTRFLYLETVKKDVGTG